MSPTDLLLYDGHCRLCSASARSLMRWADGALTLQSFRDLDVAAEYGLTLEACERAIHLVRSDGVIEHGVGALLGAVRHRWFAPLFSWVRLPGIWFIADRVYALVSKWRFRLAGTTCDGGCSIYRA